MSLAPLAIEGMLQLHTMADRKLQIEDLKTPEFGGHISSIQTLSYLIVNL